MFPNLISDKKYISHQHTYSDLVIQSETNK